VPGFLEALRQRVKVDLGQVKWRRPRLADFVAGDRFVEQTVDFPNTGEMSARLGFSLKRMASARVVRQPTRLANSSAEGSGFTAR